MGGGLGEIQGCSENTEVKIMLSTPGYMLYCTALGGFFSFSEKMFMVVCDLKSVALKKN